MKTTDGEILAIDQSGRISFNLLRHHRSHAQALLFYMFDVIVCQGKSLVSTPLEKKQALLNYLFVDLGKNASPLCLEMKNCVWVKPERSCKSRIGEWTPDGNLRHSKFVGLREDKEPSEVLPER
jgi:ATP-dependent DNA ligase